MNATTGYIPRLPPARLLLPKPSHGRQDYLGPLQLVFFEVVGGHNDSAIHAMEVVTICAAHTEERSICVLIESEDTRLPRQLMRPGRPKVRELALAMREKTNDKSKENSSEWWYQLAVPRLLFTLVVVFAVIPVQ
jgi:hypothetical protein